MQDIDVLIVGCGPVGALMGNMLGEYGINTLIVERNSSPHGEPRAFSCDDEAMRIYQRAGLVDEIQSDMVYAKMLDYVGVNGRKFAEINLENIDFGMGHHALNFFHQSKLEHTLRKGLERFNHVKLLLGHEIIQLKQQGDHVTVSINNVADGEGQSIQCKYAVGCDGSNSTVRKMLDIDMIGIGYKEPWLAVSGFVDDKYVKVPNTRFVCDPDRPVFIGKGAEGDFRMEFMMREGESNEDILRKEKIRELISPFVDPDNIEISRTVVYNFGKAKAKQWKLGNVFLLGDAAHLMPPMMGQGLVSGLRDVANLSWKLASVLDGKMNSAILDSYEVEREGHTQEMIDISSKMAGLFMERRRWAAKLRDRLIILLTKIPRVRNFIQKGEFKPLPKYDKGLFVKTKSKNKNAEGTLFPQVEVRVASGETKMLDDLSRLDMMMLLYDCDIDTVTSQIAPQILDCLNVFKLANIGSETIAESQIVDESGKLEEWFNKYKVNFALLRPDKFVFVTGTAQEASQISVLYEQYFGKPQAMAVLA